MHITGSSESEMCQLDSDDPVQYIKKNQFIVFFENQMSYHFQSGDPQAPQVWPVVIGCIWIFVASNNLKKLEIWYKVNILDFSRVGWFVKFLPMA